MSTRRNKEVLSHDVLDQRWKKQIKEAGFDAKQISTPAWGKSASTEEIDIKKFLAESVKTSPEKGRRHHIEAARATAIKYGVGGADVHAAFQEHLAKRIVNVKWKQVFKKAPSWSPASLIKAPVIVLGNPKEYRRWGDIKFERKTALGHFRIQERFLAPNAPRVSPLHNLKLPALRYGKMRLREYEKWGKTKWKKNLGIAELRIQQRRLFPRALPWNPAKNLKAPVIRFVPKEKKAISDRQQQYQSMDQSL